MNNLDENQKIDTSWNKNEQVYKNKSMPTKNSVSLDKEKILDPFEEAEIKAKGFTSPQQISTKIETPKFAENNVYEPKEPMARPKKIITPKETDKPIKTFTTPILEKKPEEITSFNKQKEESKIPQPPIKQAAKTPLWKSILKTLGLFVGITLFVYIAINFSALYEKIKFLINPPKIAAEDLVTSQTETSKYLPPSGPIDVFFSFAKTAFSMPIKYVAPPKEETTQTQPTTETKNESSGESSSPEIANNTLIIPRLGKKVPIVWESPPDEATMLANLKKGVVHYAGTALPGQGKGPIFISGHSSYYSWDPGKYKTVFANLDKVKVGDQIQIKYEGNLYTYKVFETVVVNPDQLDVLTPVNEPILDLMTCVPVGTNKQRLIVKAKQI